MRKSSSGTATPVSVPTPTRELSFRNGAYITNITRLEQSAEKMSEDGSDIGEEIRRLNDAEKLRSRQNSIQNSHQGDVISGRTAPLEASRSRGSSNVVDLNGVARQGGFSPGGYVGSPVGSVRSHESWSRHTSTHRKPSTGSRLATQMPQSVQEGRLVNTSAVGSSPQAIGDQTPSRHVSQASRASHTSESSFAKRYDQIAGQIQEQLVDVPPTPPAHGNGAPGFDFGDTARDMHTYGDGAQIDRPHSQDTYREAQSAFKDFDGVHFSPERQDYIQLDDEGNEIRRMSMRKSSGALSMRPPSMLRVPQSRPMSYATPLPDENMVYYPAPVPRMLNLPKRLSQLPSSNVQAQRRTQVLSQIPAEARNSAAWLSQTTFDNPEHRRTGSSSQGDSARAPLNERMSMMNFQNLPPQLRASVFFEHQSQPQDVAIMQESAVATLDNILAASVTAPVSAFTDHPFAGDVRSTVYAPERIARRSTNTLIQKATNAPFPEPVLIRRRSSLGMLLRGTSESNGLGRRGSRTSTLMDFNEGGNKLKKRKSMLRFAGELDRPESIPLPQTPADELEFEDGILGGSRHASGSRPVTAGSGALLVDDEQDEQDFIGPEQEGEEEEEYDPENAGFVQPSTLLAELQVRKAQQKSRNRTAVTAFPNGMHSTLLQLDAVADIEKRKRQRSRIALAWEDPSTLQHAADEAEEDDVPLGILFPSKNGLANRAMGDERDWDRPLGLMEKRQMEDNEPLSSRRSRLRGGPALSLPRTRDRSPDKRGMSQLNLTGLPGDEDTDENEGETLAQRLRRLRTKQELDVAISDIAPKEGERPMSTFSADVLSQFDGLTGNDKAGIKPPPTPEALADETLAQRRARLQREGATRNASEPAATAGATEKRRSLCTSNSMANLLSSHPIGPTPTRRVTDRKEPVKGSLLDTSVKQQATAKRQLLETNQRSSSYGLDRSLLERQRAANGLPGIAPPGASIGAGAPPLFSSPSGLGFQQPYPQHNPYASYAPQQAQPQMNPLAYNALMGLSPTPAAYPYAGMPQYGQMGMGQQVWNGGMGWNPAMGLPMGIAFGMAEEQMSPQQRANIDAWREGVAH
ncbi:hypothetical protein B0A48_01689 [Cryoendolithus antarcticus]|uniref:Uncharacterized protein n=1 Tax=Cryoendolithus antarcticus TaxID=1507870 RepID=A0A1V8TQE0_9PEZI|nr:hypothetical protein B0A48_01689 [Cryoendolithus antarcticus]